MQYRIFRLKEIMLIYYYNNKLIYNLNQSKQPDLNFKEIMGNKSEAASEFISCVKSIPTDRFSFELYPRSEYLPNFLLKCKLSLLTDIHLPVSQQKESLKDIPGFI